MTEAKTPLDVPPISLSSSAAVDLWQQLAQWNDLDSQTLERLKQLGSVRDYPEGAVLFSEGELHPQLYFLCNGAVQLDMATPGSKRQTILSIGPGDLLAWSALVGDCVMTATAIATRPTTVVAFSAVALKQALEQDERLGYQVMKLIARALSRRLVATRLQLLDLYRD